MDYNTSRKRTNRILYLTVILMLCVLAVIAALANASKRTDDNDKPPVSDTTTAETTKKDNAIATTKPEESTSISETTDETVKFQPTDGDVSAEVEVIEESETDATDANSAPDLELPSFIAPVIGSISAEYSDAVLVYSQTMNDYRTHTGVDIEAELGSTVNAVADGVISEIWEDVKYGTSVSVTHGGGAVSTYKNLNPESVAELEPGMSILCGDIIGAVGESAMTEIACEPHLHFELSIDNVSVNPCDYISFQTEPKYEG